MPKRKTNKAKRVTSQCKNNGSCPACKSNRTHANRKRKEKTYEAVE